MKKNFIKVSVICALTLASSTAVVSCSDYDDDIKNHQEQIDALKKQLDASKTEITEGLNTAIEGLKAEITEIAGSKADAASVKALEQKAAELQQALDSKASNEQITALSEEVKGLINDVNTELSAAMKETKTSLEGQISTLQQKQDELNKKIEGLDNSEEIATIQSELDKVTSDLAKAQNDLKTILDANYGQKINDLQQRVTNLEGLKAELENYTDEAIKNLKPEITAEIQAAINGVKELIPENLDSRLTTLEEKIANYITANDLQAEVDALESLINTKEEGLKALIDGKVSQDQFNELQAEVNALEEKIVSSETIDEKIQTEIKALREDVKKLLGIMVQSIMYVPQFDGNLQPTHVAFNTLYAQPTIGGNPAKVADNVTSKVQFRVTPASAAASFKDNYKITFEGKWIGQTRAAQENYLNAEYVADADAEAKGIVTFNVSRSTVFSPGQAYALCAHIAAINEEGKTENMTDISSDFFVASHSDITVKNIEVVAPNFNNAKTVAWNDTKTSFTPGTVTLKGTKLDNTTINDLAAIFGADKFTVKYALTDVTTNGANAFQINENTGEVKVKSASSSAINSKAGVKATNPDIKVVTQYADSFTDAAKGKTIAASMVAGGADVIFQAAGGTGSGVFAEAKATNQKLSDDSDKKVWVIGVDMDQKRDGDYKDKDNKQSNFTLVSAVKRVDNAVKSLSNKAKDGKFPGGQTITYGLKENGVGVAKDSASSEVWSAIESAQKKIISGDIKVPVHP